MIREHAAGPEMWSEPTQRDAQRAEMDLVFGPGLWTCRRHLLSCVDGDHVQLRLQRPPEAEFHH